MSPRAAAWLAWSLCALALALIAGSLVLGVLGRADLAQLALPFPLVASAIVGGLVASRRPGNLVGWLFLASSLASSIEAFAGEYAVYGILADPGSLPLAQAMAWFSHSLEVVGPVLGLVLLPLYFPNGRPVSPRWNLLAWLALCLLLVATVLRAFSPGEAVYESGIPNPLGVEALRPFSDALDPLFLASYIGMIFAAAVSLVIRLRRSSGGERQQIKWFAYAASFVPVWFLVNYPIDRAFPALFQVMDALVLAGVPLAAGIAILRYRLYDIDLIINRTLVYGALSASLALVYVGSVVLLQGVLRTLTGQESQLAIVASTLAVAALFNPLRRRIQGFIDRRFYRSKYDAARTLGEFSAKLRDETDLDALNDELVGVVRETMQPTHVSLWLRSDLAPRRSEGPE